MSEVERAFGVKLDYSACGEWTTVGDIFAALKDALKNAPGDQDLVWSLFKYAISRETLVEPARIDPATLLLAEPLSDQFARLMHSLGAMIRRLRN
ncbi:MAG: hypothetical protein A3E78_13985 [Alphaproteobacteria bacterium RIFCSPHIGHO2_12_FULL_63_12]|nr:MAG: hypothetical protein A3E78_13985 [Alphaproteobacteria bacterium RIFCSPHIGHO2_12_FULL_63_12]